MLFDGFSPEEILALSKISGTSDNRDKVGPGIHSIDLIAQIRGEIKVGKDHEAAQPNAIPWQRIAMRLLSKVNGPTRRKVIADSLQAEAGDAGEIKAEAQAIVDELLGETVQPRKGAVRAELIAVNVTSVVKLPAAPRIHKVSPETSRKRARGRR